MTANKEYSLIRSLPQRKPEGKWQWAFKITIGVIAIAYALNRLVVRDYPWDVVVIISVIALVILFVQFMIIRNYWNKPHTFLKIKDNNLYIKDKKATLWSKPTNEIIDIAVAEPKIKWKIVLRNKTLIIKTKNDSYSLDLQYSKFDGYSLDDVIRELRLICDLNT